MNPTFLAIAAIIPLAVGTTPAQHENALIVSLCNGGSITIPLGDDDSDPEQPCHTKACHAGTCRKDAGKMSGRAKG